MFIHGEDNRFLVLDMDGTIADTYNYPDWAGILRGHVANPWTECGIVDSQEVFNMFLNVKPMLTEDELKIFCSKWDEVVVWSMAPWDATPEVERATVAAKIEWLEKYFPFLTRNVIITKHQDNKNFVLFENTLWRNLEFENALQFGSWWSPGKDDTLVDDNQNLLDNFVGHKMLPPWLHKIL
jgi:5'(3')-deoxyribonucleotidase